MMSGSNNIATLNKSSVLSVKENAKALKQKRSVASGAKTGGSNSTVKIVSGATSYKHAKALLSDAIRDLE